MAALGLPIMRGSVLTVDETGVGTAVTDMLRVRNLSPRAPPPPNQRRLVSILQNALGADRFTAARTA